MPQTDQSVIRGWWATYPNANVGVYTGDLFVLDVDRRHGGDATLQQLTAVYGDLPPTVTVRTGDGWHYYFRRPDGEH